MQLIKNDKRIQHTSLLVFRFLGEAEMLNEVKVPYLYLIEN